MARGPSIAKSNVTARCKGEDCTAFIPATRTSGYCAACKYTHDRSAEVRRNRGKREAQRSAKSSEVQF